MSGERSTFTRKPLRTCTLLCMCFLVLLVLIACMHATVCYGKEETPLLDLRVGADRVTVFIEDDFLKVVVSGYCREEVGVVSGGVFHRITPITSDNMRVYLVRLTGVAPSDYLVIRAGSTANMTINLYNIALTIIAEKMCFEGKAASVSIYGENISTATVSPATLCKTSVTATTVKAITKESKAGYPTTVIEETSSAGEKAMSYEKGVEMHEKPGPKLLSEGNIVPLVIGAIIGLITYMVIVRFV